MADLKWVKTNFGDMLDVQKSLPLGCDLIILCVNDQIGGHKPKLVRLPHQLYRKDFEKLLESYPHARDFTVIPVRSSEKIDIPLVLLADE